MVWIPDEDLKPKRSETSKCRFRLMPYCLGIGLDIGCGDDKVRADAIGVDIDGKADINMDITKGLYIFSDEVFDYVFSAHCLEDFDYPSIILKDWWRLLKVGGHLVLNLPHKNFYPNIGQAGCNITHKHDFLPQDIIDMMDKFASYVILHRFETNERDEYGFDIVFKKLANFKIPAKFMSYSSRAINFDWNEVGISRGVS
jgi:SAM-dependent methyltransferase